ncbi:MAG TPA: CpaF family protein [Anaerolineales bacterium]|nr:CpaF family protein [Anaerolineales bacterium]
MTAQPPATPRPEDISKLKGHLVNTVNQQLTQANVPAENRPQVIGEMLTRICQQARISLPETLRSQVFDDVRDEVLGFGPIQKLLDEDAVSEVMVNGPKRVYVERKGKVTKSDVTFDDDAHVMRIINKIIAPMGRRVDADSPTVDARLPDGSRVNAVIPPVALDGPSITIRKFGKGKLTIEQLIEYKSITAQMAEFLRACVVAKLNIVISGGTGSGKTTLLNVLSSFIPEEDRIITIEDAAELRLNQEHVVRLETKPANLDGKGVVTTRDLVRNSLRMRPERIVVGECRGGETLDMLQAMNTGHDGSLTTLHANTPRDALSRLETMTMMSGMDLPLRVIREQIASAIDLIVQQSRMRDGTRKVTAITEVAGMEGETVILTDIFKFEQTGLTQDGKVLGDLKPSGIRPMFSPRLEAAGFKLGPEVFGASVADILAANRRRK